MTKTPVTKKAETFWCHAVLGTNEEGKPNHHVHFTVTAEDIYGAWDAVEEHAARFYVDLLPRIKFWLIGDRTIWADASVNPSAGMARFPLAYKAA